MAIYFIFETSACLNSIMDSLLRYAHIAGTSCRVLRYLDRPVTKSGRPDSRAQDTVVTRITDFNDGVRLHHWILPYGQQFPRMLTID